MKICPICEQQYEQGEICPVDGATLIDQNVQSPLIGTVIKGMYRIESKLAEGGMSQVYIARQLSLDRLVVVKLLKTGMHDKDFVQLFFREARIASQLNHPNVMQVLDFGNTDDGMMYLVVEYLRGENLADLVEKRRGLPLENIVWLMEQVATGLQAAHHLNIVHRDLKPSNILVAKISGDHSVAKLLDFGISKPLGEQDLKYTQLGMVMGTPGYLAPEQIEGSRSIDLRADIYALGAILYFCIMGEKPFKGDSPQQIMAKQSEKGPEPLEVSKLKDARNQIFEPIIKKAMAINTSDRFQDVTALLEAIKTAVKEVPLQPPLNSENAEIYQVVFYGEIEPKVQVEDVKSKLAASLGLKENSLNKLFGGKRVIVKKDINLAKAKKFDAAFRAAGALAQIEEADSTRIAPNFSQEDRSLSEPIVVASATLAEPVSLSSFSTSPSPASQPSGSLVSSPAIPTSPSMGPQSVTFSQPVAVNVNADQQRKSPKQKLMLLTALVLGVVILAGYFIQPVRYRVLDVVASIQGWQSPRGVTSDSITMGMSGAFSGTARELGRSMQLGMSARFKEINDSGGINGREIILKALDDGYEPDRAAENAKSFLTKDSASFAMIGNIGTPTAEAVLPIALQNKMIIFGTFSGAEVLRKHPPERYVFNYRASYAQETAALINYFVELRGLSPIQIGVFYQDDGFGRDGLLGVEDALFNYGIKPHQVPKYAYKRNTVRVDDAVNHFLQQQEGVSAVVIVGTYNASAHFTKRLREGGFKGLIANVSFVGMEALAEKFREIGNEYGEGVIVSQVVPPFDSYATDVIRYREMLKKYFPSEHPNFVSLEGYIVASLWIDALMLDGRHFTTESIVDTLSSMQDIDVGIGTRISFDSTDHQASNQVWGTQLDRDGSFKTIRLDKP